MYDNEHKLLFQPKEMDKNIINEILFLLKHALNELDEHYGLANYGMCIKISNMREDGILTHYEQHMFYSFMKENKPDDANAHYWWPCNEKQSRLEWIDKHLKLTS